MRNLIVAFSIFAVIAFAVILVLSHAKNDPPDDDREYIRSILPNIPPFKDLASEGNTRVTVYGLRPNADDSPLYQWERELYATMLQGIDKGLAQKSPSLHNMAHIPAGRYVLGETETEITEHRFLRRQAVELESFYIDKTVVTADQYNRCVAEKMCLPMLAMDRPGQYGSDFPALLVYKQAERYCHWAGKRLPTEYEWEAAARGGDQRIYPWGDEPPTDKLANICGAECGFAWSDPDWHDGYLRTSPVDAFPDADNPFGLRQLVGNVKEWVDTHRKLPKNFFIARSASWYSDLHETPLTYSQLWFPGTRTDDKGVRCAISASAVKSTPSK